jgi:hypothetical protein
MGSAIMKAHVHRQFIKEVEKVFSTRYPYLKMEFSTNDVRWLLPEVKEGNAGIWRHQAEDILDHEIGLKDGMTVGELETRLKDVLGVPVVILRRSGDLWIETSMTQKWTLKEQNVHGKELSEP